ncbi:MAG: cation-translocating P-type ATPase [Synechococcaceae cyanobacterium]|nr:cation-translocating P-type ATPase [Synechococcaceae cyanobacterium]
MPLLLEVEGLRCGGCVRAVERRLQQQAGVRQASVDLLTGTAWVELEPAGDPEGSLPDLLLALSALGFPARPRAVSPLSPPASGEGGEGQEGWWGRWRGLLVALTLLLASGLGHLAHAQPPPVGGVGALLAGEGFHALVATLALAGPGRRILGHGVRTALAGMPGMDTLVGLGVASAYGSSLVGWLLPATGWPCYFDEPVMLLGFVLTGRFLEERARFRSGRALEELAALQPDHALLELGDGSPRPVPVDGLRPGDRVRLLPGDRVPVDGVVVEGRSSVDVSGLTGESEPRPAAPGGELAAGFLNLEAPLLLEVRRGGAESAIARILNLVAQAQARKAPIQRLADRVAGRFTLVVLVLALATLLFGGLWGGRHGPGVLEGGFTPLTLGLQLAIAVLVVACPCALGLATPAALAVGAARAARAGLLFRGGDAIEAAARVQAVVFDKTGTLTEGHPQVIAVEPFAAAGEGGADRLLRRAAGLEQHSRHPLGRALLREARRRGLALPPPGPSRSSPGEGVEGVLKEGEGSGAGLCRVGRPEWLAARGVAIEAGARERIAALEAGGASLLAVSSGPCLLGLVAVEDRPRPDAAATLAALRRQGLRLALLSGDRPAAVARLAGRVGLEPGEIASDLRPEQKLARLRRERSRGPVAMVGDGINDAPALAAADLGVAVGTGTQIAQEAAGLVVMGERLDALVGALAIARRTMATVRANLLLAIGYNLVLLPIAAGALLPGFGLRLSPPLAALFMALSSLTVVLNALLLRGGPEGGEEAA